MKAKERAKRALDTSRPHVTDKHSRQAVPPELEGMVALSSMPGTTTFDMVSRVADEIVAAEREATKKCLVAIRESVLCLLQIKPDGISLSKGRDAIRDVVKKLKKEGAT